MTVTIDGTYGITTQNVNNSIQPITASVASNALTVTLNQTSLSFRNTPLTSGAVNVRSVNSPISITVSSGSTLGTVSAQQSRIVVLALDNAGTVELAVVNISGGNQLDETNLISTTAEGGAGAADSANVVYSTTARTSLPYRVVGYIESTQTTAGTWAAAPSTIQGTGGQALAAMSSLGYGQVWTDVTASRAVTTTYYNTTGKPIFVSISVVMANGSPASITVGSISIITTSAFTANARAQASFIVPAGISYSLSSANVSSIGTWNELR